MNGRGIGPNADFERLRAHIRQRIAIEDCGYRSPCWVWQSGINGSGYGTGRPAGCGFVLIHRLSFQVFKGEIGEGRTIDHLCRNRACCNPDHLEAVSPKENNWRALRPYYLRNSEKAAANAGGGGVETATAFAQDTMSLTHRGESV